VQIGWHRAMFAAMAEPLKRRVERGGVAGTPP
jgi:hypothetical protein